MSPLPAPAQEINLRIGCYVKGLAAGGHLPLLAMEEALHPCADPEGAKKMVPEDLVKDARLARLACNDMLAQQTVNAELAKDILVSIGPDRSTTLSPQWPPQ